MMLRFSDVFGVAQRQKPADVLAFEAARNIQQQKIAEVKETADVIAALVKGLTSSVPKKRTPRTT